MKTLRRVFDRLVATRTTLAKVRDKIDHLPADAFYEVRAVGPYDEATRVHLQLQRRRLEVKEVELADSRSETVLTFGKRRFILAAGAAWRSLRKRESGRVQGFEGSLDGELALDMDGKPKSGTVIDLTEDSPSRVTPLLILHGRVTPTWPLFLSLGLTAHSDNQGADIELLVGPSVEIVPERFFLTVGACWGKFQSLGGDRFLGAPAGEEEVPVYKNARWQIGASLSYRIPTGGGR